MASDTPLKATSQMAGVAPRPLALTAAERALKESLEPREFRDVHLYAFTRRTLYPDGSIRIDKPQPIVAIGSILKDADHFSKLLTSGFSETAQDLDDSASPVRECALESEYDYETDSDLDEFEETDGSAHKSNIAGPSKAKGKGRDDSRDDPDPPNPAPKKSACHRILIPSIAHRTLKACVFYLYTDKINFLPLTSEGTIGRKFALLTTSDAAPACSPKSMYRLAEAYGIRKLQDLAYQEIVSHLRPANIVEEAFSSFFARYPRLREHAVSYLSQHYADPAVQQKLPDAIDKIVFGYMPHAGDILRSLLGLRVAVAHPVSDSSSSSGMAPLGPIPGTTSDTIAISTPRTEPPQAIAAPSSTPSSTALPWTSSTLATPAPQTVPPHIATSSSTAVPWTINMMAISTPRAETPIAIPSSAALYPERELTLGWSEKADEEDFVNYNEVLSKQVDFANPVADGSPGAKKKGAKHGKGKKTVDTKKKYKRTQEEPECATPKEEEEGY